ncbi:putative 40S ribosomal protein S8-like [Iris pallida]|uniref:40S ribosomal protein S8 n=1 Tax=Iris pallida TaxID=29817 RepID=A0AAX6I9C5_IRIPA|nr:putative 40S ribosomal protein S8-like [Iris pallida]
MGISRDSMHKRRATGGKKKAWRKKRKYEMGRQPAMTKLSSNKTVRRVRVRGGNVKWRALRLDTGNYSWGSEAVTRKTRILDVVYNASNNELVRTQLSLRVRLFRLMLPLSSSGTLSTMGWRLEGRRSLLLLLLERRKQL